MTRTSHTLRRLGGVLIVAGLAMVAATLLMERAPDQAETVARSVPGSDRSDARSRDVVPEDADTGPLIGSHAGLDAYSTLDVVPSRVSSDVDDDDTLGTPSLTRSQAEEVSALILLSRTGQWTEAADRADELARVAETPEIRCEALALAASSFLRDGDPNMASDRLATVDAECAPVGAWTSSVDETRSAIADLLADSSVGRARDLVRMGLWDEALEEALLVLGGSKTPDLEATCEALALADLAVRRGAVELPADADFAQRFDAECRDSLGEKHWIVVGYGTLGDQNPAR